MYVVLQGAMIGATRVEGEAETRERHLGVGNTANMLCILGIWDRCLETVAAVTAVEAYAVSVKDFVMLFSTETDLMAYERMQFNKVADFAMDPGFEGAPTVYGRPLHFSCFTQVTVRISQLYWSLALDVSSPSTSAGLASPGKRQGILGRLTGASRKRVSDNEVTWMTVDLVDLAGRPLGEIWKYTTDQVLRSPPVQALAVDGAVTGVDPSIEPVGDVVWADSQVRWSDVAAPFEKTAVRVRLYESDSLNGEEPVAWCMIRLVDLDGSLKHDQPQTLPLCADMAVDGTTKSLAEKPDGSLEAWFSLDEGAPALEGALASQSPPGHPPSRGNSRRGLARLGKPIGQHALRQSAAARLTIKARRPERDETPSSSLTWRRAANSVASGAHTGDDSRSGNGPPLGTALSGGGGVFGQRSSSAAGRGGGAIKGRGGRRLTGSVK